MADALPVLWIYGPSGVGKTTVGWAFYTRLLGFGHRAGFVDIDQLGMCYGPPTANDWSPEPVSDPVRYRLKTLNLDAVAAHHRALGSRCLVVAGIIDPEHGVDSALLPHVDLTLCRLRAEPAELARRIAARGRNTDDLEDVLRDARALDRHDFPGVCVETTGLGPEQVLARIREATAGWPGVALSLAVGGVRVEPSDDRTAQGAHRADGEIPPPRPTVRTTAPVEVLFLCGPTAVGKSTVGWFGYVGSRRLGRHTAFVDLGQIGFQRPTALADPGNHRLKAANLAALWRNFHARGARGLVINGSLDRPEDLRRYSEALPAARIVVGRLHAAPERLAERIAQRAAGAGSVRGLAGDELLGLSGAALRRAVDRSVAEAAELDRVGLGDLRVVTDARSPRELAEEILRSAAWS